MDRIARIERLILKAYEALQRHQTYSAMARHYRLVSLYDRNGVK